MPISKDNTAKFFREASGNVSKNLKTATLMVERSAKEFAFSSVDTGTLRRSITHEFLSKHLAIVGSNVVYAPYVELGTSKMSAQPYLRPALHKNLGFIKRMLLKK